MKSVLRKLRRSHLATVLLSHKKETLLVVGLLVLAGVVHAWNMFQYPYYESDEGTYMAQAWALVDHGQLAPYTYWYDHAPGGWMLIAIWLKLTGGLFTFGFALNSGRVLMLLLHLGSALLLYLVARQLSKSRFAATLAVLFFSLSPLAIYFQRRVLLDNIMIFWVLLSVYLVLYHRNKLRYIIGSAIAMGIAILSKENAVFFVPLVMFIVYTQAHHKHRNFAVFQWLGITGAIVTLYFLYALLKGELFPTGTFLGGSHSHVSLLGTLEFQGNRGSIPITDPDSSFWSVARRWLKDDPIIIIGGALSTIGTLLLGIKQRGALLAGAFSLLYWIFLLRGGLVLEFYIIPLIPVSALCMAYFINAVYVWLRSIKRWPLLFKPLYIVPLGGAAVILFFMVVHFSLHFRQGQNIYTSDQTTAQTDAVDWILSQKHPDKFYVIDNYAFLDLKLRNNGNFSRADYYWKVDQDRDIRDAVIHQDWNNIDYIAFTPLIGGDLGTGELPLVGTALANSNPIKSFRGDGWYVQMWAVKNPDRILDTAWSAYKKTYMTGGNGGQVVDPAVSAAAKPPATTSAAQADALLRAVWMDDKPAFNSVLRWSKAYLQQPSGLFAAEQPAGPATDPADEIRTDSGADTDMAMALLLASKKWHSPIYTREAHRILDGIWQQEVVDIAGRPYIMAGNWADQPTAVTVSPARYSPAAYKIFAAADPINPWNDLVPTTYETLNACTIMSEDNIAGVLPPDWCTVSTTDGSASVSVVPGVSSAVYSRDAGATLQRVLLDYQWNKDIRAKQYLTSLKVLSDKYTTDKKLLNAYTHAGRPWENYESAGAYSHDLAYFSIVDTKSAARIYDTQILNKFYEDDVTAYWEDAGNGQTQRAAWLGTALYTKSIKSDWPIK